MMTKIKYALSFIFGLLYMGAIWHMSKHPLIEGQNPTGGVMTFLSTTYLAIGGMLIVWGIVWFFVEYWGKE